jgi:hypothetical protein
MPICELETIEDDATPLCEEMEVAIETPPPEAPGPHHRRRPWRWVFAAFFAIVCLAAGLFLNSVAAAPTRIEPLPFGFQAGQRQDRVALTWNPTARAVRDATRATLTIQDGPETEDVELNPAVLRLGGLSYNPVFQDLSFRLSLAGSSRRTVSEQVHVSLRP